MIEVLLTLIANLPNAQYVPKDRPLKAATAIVQALEEAPALPPIPNAKVTLGKVLFTWGYFESGWIVRITGDQGRSCGPTQINQHFTDCKRVQSDAVFAYRETLRLLAEYYRKCGSLGGALSLYSSGRSCTAAKKGVLARCKRAGVDCA